MIEHEIDLATSDGTMTTFVTHPEEGGPFPVVLFFMDAPGKRKELHDMARRIGTVGYCVLLPNLYYRDTEHFVVDRDDPDSVAMMGKLMGNLSNAKVVDDTGALVGYVDGYGAADGSRIGCIGYCMSGPFSLSVAAAYPERIACAASLYGVRLATEAPDSPHRTAPAARGELYIAHAELDEHIDREQVERLGRALEEAGVRHRVEVYPGAQHGFAFPDRAGKFDKALAERHWERLFALFRRNLGG